MKQLNEQQLQVPVPIVAWRLIVLNAIILMVALGMFALMMLAGRLVYASEARMILLVIGAILPTIMGLPTVPDFIAAFGLLARKRWGRILGVVVGILNLPGFPVGTLVGGYAIFVLMHGGTSYLTLIAIPFYVANTLTLGLASGYLTMKTDSIWGATVIRAAADFFLFVAVLANA